MIYMSNILNENSISPPGPLQSSPEDGVTDFDRAARVAGQYVAMGTSFPDVINRLLTEGFVQSREEGQSVLFSIFDGWKGDYTRTWQRREDVVNYHLFMRQRLLELTLQSQPRVALAVLDSMATIQGVSQDDQSENELPLVIQFVPTTIAPHTPTTVPTTGTPPV